MKIALAIGSPYYDGSDWEHRVELVRHADRAGMDMAWSAEAWGMETVAPLAYLAAVTERIRLGSSIMQISARTPSMTAMTALTMARLTRDRFCLGLGVSGPQVVEGLHGVPFGHALGRLREYVTIVRLALAGERVAFSGKHYQLPLPGGEGKALRLSMPAKPDLPIYLATLGPKSLELTGELADGWLGTSFIPEAAEEVLGHLRVGAERAGRALSDLDLQVGVSVVVDDDVERLIRDAKPQAAFRLGAMGSAQSNFYNAAYARAGWADVAAEVQRLWVAGKRDAAIRAVPDAFVLATAVIGDEAMVRERLRAYQDVGISTLRVHPEGATIDVQMAKLEQLLDLARQVSAGPEVGPR